ncbi:MAG: acetyl-CoA C-acyltransferase, partial [Rhodobacteraceae bacterium]|nr:acetyl-CoA C-acyltransferase [Paracoccaceae bacterium]
MKDVFIYDAVRTPRGKGRKDGALHEVSALNLATTVLNEIKNRNALDGHAVEDVILGNVTQVGEQGACLARTAVLASDLDEAIPGLAINRFCASGLEAPMMSDGGAVGVDPSFTFDNYFVPQGIGADIIATEYGFSRDMADEMAVESQRRAKAAWDDNRFEKSVVPVRDVNGLTILDHDEYMRPTTDMQSLGALKPSFKEQGEVMP